VVVSDTALRAAATDDAPGFCKPLPQVDASCRKLMLDC